VNGNFSALTLVFTDTRFTIEERGNGPVPK